MNSEVVLYTIILVLIAKYHCIVYFLHSFEIAEMAIPAMKLFYYTTQRVLSPPESVLPIPIPPHDPLHHTTSQHTYRYTAFLYVIYIYTSYMFRMQVFFLFFYYFTIVYFQFLIVFSFLIYYFIILFVRLFSFVVFVRRQAVERELAAMKVGGNSASPPEVMIIVIFIVIVMVVEYVLIIVLVIVIVMVIVLVIVTGLVIVTLPKNVSCHVMLLWVEDFFNIKIIMFYYYTELSLSWS